MPRPLLFCLKSGRSVCYSVPDNTREKFQTNGIISILRNVVVRIGITAFLLICIDIQLRFHSRGPPHSDLIYKKIKSEVKEDDF